MSEVNPGELEGVKNVRLKKTTIHDVAELANVSVTTVSRYLNQRYDAMSEETRHRIAKAITTLNYHPNALARGLKSQKSRTIAVVVVDIRYSFCLSVIRTLSQMYAFTGYSLIVSETNGNPALERQLLEQLLSQQIDALVLQTNGENDAFIQDIARVIPVVVVDRSSNVSGVTNIVTNNFESSYVLTKSLFDQGYHEVLYISESPGRISTRLERLDGYRHGCAESNRSPWIVYVNRGQPTAMRREVQSVLQQVPRALPFAVYTANALLLLDVYPVLRDAGFDIPSQMGLATFDEPDWLELVTPSITHVYQPTEEVGILTANTILNHLEKDTNKQAGKKHVLKSKLVLRDSTRIIADPELFGTSDR